MEIKNSWLTNRCSSPSQTQKLEIANQKYHLPAFQPVYYQHTGITNIARIIIIPPGKEHFRDFQSRKEEEKKVSPGNISLKHAKLNQSLVCVPQINCKVFQYGRCFSHFRMLTHQTSEEFQRKQTMLLINLQNHSFTIMSAPNSVHPELTELNTVYSSTSASGLSLIT